MQSEHQAILWVKNGCGRCEAAKEALADAQPDVRPIEMAWEGEDPLAVEVLAQLAWQDWELPVVLLADEFVEPEELLAQSCDGGAGSCTTTP
ncbi:MAG: hypothetical protein ISS72_04995 [Candidatus Brocadiae bacterium]|nr:hypothetical protein [Candidatus Brocadiia bacterium]